MPTSAPLFKTVPDQDFLGLFKGKEPDYTKVVQFAHMKKEDVARATGVNVSSVRYDEKMPLELQERLWEWAGLFNLVAGHFSGDSQKTYLWFTVPNPLLGEISPKDMIRVGRYKKLLSFVMNSLADNQAPGA